MEKVKLKMGCIPTRRINFDVADAVKQKTLIVSHLKKFDAELVDIDDINNEGILYDENDLEKVMRKFKGALVDGVIFPHCNFGNEALVAKLAKAINRPVLIWGPRDDAPLEDGIRTRDTQCGLFATGKVLRRFNIPFSYIINSKAEERVFERGYQNFIAVCSVVRAFRKLKILQIAPRPASFWTMMYNEGELLERFGIQVLPVTLSEIISVAKKMIKEKNDKLINHMEQVKRMMDCGEIAEEALKKVVALKLAIGEYCERERCSAAAIQCWDALQDEFGIVPCAANGLLTDEGIPVVCETDIHGAISAVMLQEAARRTSAVFVADFTIRHPENDQAELLWHCGSFPVGIAKKSSQPKMGRHFILPSHCPGVGEWELKEGDITLCRFDGDHGAYSLLLGEGKGINGPKTRGTYVWFETKNWPKWEERLVTGPYVHHCAGVHAKVAAALYEACKYIPGLKADPLEPTVDEINNYLRGE